MPRKDAEQIANEVFTSIAEKGQKSNPLIGLEAACYVIARVAKEQDLSLAQVTAIVATSVPMINTSMKTNDARTERGRRDVLGAVLSSVDCMLQAVGLGPDHYARLQVAGGLTAAACNDADRDIDDGIDAVSDLARVAASKLERLKRKAKLSGKHEREIKAIIERVFSILEHAGINRKDMFKSPADVADFVKRALERNGIAVASVSLDDLTGFGEPEPQPTAEQQSKAEDLVNEMLQAIQQQMDSKPAEAPAESPLETAAAPAAAEPPAAEATKADTPAATAS